MLGQSTGFRSLSVTPAPCRLLTSSSPSAPYPTSVGHHRTSVLLHSIGKRRLRITMRVSSSSSTKTSRDFYATLNLERNATLQQVKSAYRKLARKYHPDLNKSPGSEEKFKEVSAAYEVLSDEEKRSSYDRFGEAGVNGGFEGSEFRSQSTTDPFEAFESTFGESDAFFGSQFGSGGIFERFNRREDINIIYNMSLTFEESIFGGEQNIEVLRVEACEKCKGTSAKSHNAAKYCKDCDGKGRTMKTQRTPFGMVSQVSSCKKCKGIGKWIKDPCPSCHGDGTVQLKRNIKVHIPAGVYDGLVMQVKGEGHTDEKWRNW